MNTHRACRSWCKFCVMGRGVNSPHRRSDAQDDLEGCSMYRWFVGEKESEEQVSGRCWFRGKECISLDCEESSKIHQLHSDPTVNQRLRRWQGKMHKLVKKAARLCQRDRQWEKVSPTGSSNAQWDTWLVTPEH